MKPAVDASVRGKPILPTRLCGPILSVVLFGCALSPTAAPAAPPTTQPVADRAIPYSTGVRINWARLTVEVDAKIVLRHGPLELFACTPHTREHESILAVYAHPVRIFEALGLIGLEPGNPTTYDPPSGRWRPADGAPLRIDVVTHAARTEQVVGIHRWMNRGEGGPLQRRDWVFAGSRRLPDGRFAADLEGTIIAVVDFDSALIALPETHTSDNSALWLTANTPKIPPLGTPCVLRFSSSQRGRTRAFVHPDGSLRLANQPIGIAELEARVRAQLTKDPGAHLLLVPIDPSAAAHAERLTRKLTKRGLEVITRPAPPGADAPPT
ncbi:MAG: hypothetical protein GY842_28900 [bacterium]|nr:hypothetical protein [bacterium]